MKRTTPRRHILFFSTSLAAHLVVALVLVGLCLIVPDSSTTGADRPLVVALFTGSPTGNAAAPETTREKTKTAPREPVTDDKTAIKAPADTTGTDDLSGNTPRVGAGGDGTDGALLSDYIEGVHARINRHKRYPSSAARDGIEGTVTVSFLLDKHGTLLEKGIVAGSGYPVLDSAALAAVGDSSPFPPFPDGLNRETLRLRLPINYEHR